MRAAAKRWRERNPDLVRRKDREHYLRKAYDMSIDDYERLLRAQGGRCAVCGTQDPVLPRGSSSSGLTFAIDHDHQTGQIRGLLCTPCNLGIGNLGDDPERLRRAAAYLDAAHASGGPASGATTAKVVSLEPRRTRSRAA
jgi:hypothetical protein